MYPWYYSWWWKCQNYSGKGSSIAMVAFVEWSSPISSIVVSNMLMQVFSSSGCVSFVAFFCFVWFTGSFCYSFSSSSRKRILFLELSVGHGIVSNSVPVLLKLRLLGLFHVSHLQICLLGYCRFSWVNLLWSNSLRIHSKLLLNDVFRRKVVDW